MVNSQIWLDQNYPPQGKCIRKTEDEISFLGKRWDNFGKTRSEVERLEISSQNLEEELELEGFTNLKNLKCSYNKLTSLKIKNCPNLQALICNDNLLCELVVNDCPNLKTLHCENNFLTELDLSCNEKLEELILSDNDFSEQNLSFLSHLVNLYKLEIGNIMRWEKVNPDIFNCWVGSLEPLKNLTQLKVLEIDNTDLDSGLEYLPDSLVSFDCSTDKREDARVKKLETELRKYGEVREEGEFISLLRTWRISLRREELTSLQEEAKEVEENLQKQKREKEQIEEAIQRQNQEIEKLKAQLEKLQLQAQIQSLPE